MRRLLAALLVFFASAAAAQGALVAAAANVKFALDDIVAAFGRDTGHTVRVSYGATGTLAQQIENGAPFELFVAADEASIERLAAAGYTRDRGAVYAVGRLALFVPRGSTLAVDATLADLKAALADDRLKRFAIASPEHAPYGRAAQQVMERAGVWDTVRPRLVLGESVAQAMQFAAGGDAQGGLVPLALASAPALRTRGSYVAIPDAMHAPLRQRMALMKRAGAAAIAFEAYLRGPMAREILVRHGYAVP
jgi:molybdate transport system substrate-binding protein